MLKNIKFGGKVMLTTNEGEKYLSVNEVIGKYGLTVTEFRKLFTHRILEL